MIEHTNSRTLSRKYESLDYDLVENVVYLEDKHKSQTQQSYISLHGLQRWLAIFVIGLATAASGFFAGSAVTFLTSYKFSQIRNITDWPECQRNETNNNTFTQYQVLKCMLPAYVVWLGWNILFTLAGSLMVTYISPVAAGSGIPVVKCYLNGVRVPEVVRFKTYLVKLLGVVSSVVGGLAVGKEGPFIHCGAAIGAGVSQGKSTTLGFDMRMFRAFRNDRDKRDFVSAGASAGVAAAFGAPIGGVLFALEEGASFWNQALTWRIFFCSMMTSFTLNLFLSAYNHQGGILAFYSLVNFGLVEELDYFWFEIPIYIGIAVFGGIIGASFCYFHVIITKYRQRYLVQRWSKVLEAILIATLTTTLGTILILYASECRELPTTEVSDILDNNSSMSAATTAIPRSSLLFNMGKGYQFGSISSGRPITYDRNEEIKRALKGHILTFLCPPGQYSAMSSLWLKTSEGVSSTFMVLQESIWSMKTLSIFLIIYYLLTVITYGLSVSSGVFIPSLLIGATGGRLVGLVLLQLFGPKEWLIQQNKFAIIGAVSVLGGVVRMTISLTVIVIEATGCISFGLPIMICLMISKWVADSFVEGLYDLAIKMANVPFLDWEPPSRSYTIYASDIMEPQVRVLRTTETVANLINILKSSTHNGFPVVDVDFTGDEFSGPPPAGSYYAGYQHQQQHHHRSTAGTSELATGIDGTGDTTYCTAQQSQEQSKTSLSSTNNAKRTRRRKLNQSGRASSEQDLIESNDEDTIGSNDNNFNGSTLQHHNHQNQRQQQQQHQLDSSGNLSGPEQHSYDVGSFQRCSYQGQRQSFGRFRGLILRWQLLVMLQRKIFNENERSYENLNLAAFQNSYPKYPKLDEVIDSLEAECYQYHVDLRSIMNPTPYIVHYSASFPRIYQMFRSLGLRHLVVIDDRNFVVGMITRKDLARYVRERDANGSIRFFELDYSS